MDRRIFDEPKIDCHVHVFDPARFPYGESTHYRPAGQEVGTPAQLAQAMDAYGTRCALLVGPNSGYGLDQSGFRALVELGATKRVFVKLSGLVKFSHEPSPHRDAWPYVQALVEAFTLDRCLWASDWPYLRAPARVDYGVLLNLVVAHFPDASARRKLLWDTPRELLGFAA